MHVCNVHVCVCCLQCTCCLMCSAMRPAPMCSAMCHVPCDLPCAQGKQLTFIAAWPDTSRQEHKPNPCTHAGLYGLYDYICCPCVPKELTQSSESLCMQCCDMYLLSSHPIHHCGGSGAISVVAPQNTINTHRRVNTHPHTHAHTHTHMHRATMYT